jgi:hypothetical protein
VFIIYKKQMGGFKITFSPKNGSIHERSQVYNPVPEQLVMRDRTGKFMMINSDGKPFKEIKRMK